MRSVSRRRLLSVAAGGLGAILAGCDAGPDSSGIAKTPVGGAEPVPGATALTPEAVPTPEPVSLDDKIGQMLLCGFRGPTLDVNHPVGAEVASGRLGNVVLFDWHQAGQASANIHSPRQLAELTGQIKTLAPRLPLIAVDQEGGQVARLNPAHVSMTCAIRRQPTCLAPTSIRRSCRRCWATARRRSPWTAISMSTCRCSAKP